MNRLREQYERRRAAAKQERLSTRDEERRRRARANQRPFAGEHKTWWTEAELAKWILYKGLAPDLSANPSMMEIVVHRALLAMRVPPDKAPLYGGTQVATVLRTIAKAVKRGMLRTKSMRKITVYNAGDAKRLWPSVSGPGKGRQRKIAAEGRLVERLAQVYATSSRRITREKAFDMFSREGLFDRVDGGMGTDRFQRLRSDALMLAGRNIAAEWRAHVIDSETRKLRLDNLALQKGPARGK